MTESKEGEYASLADLISDEKDLEVTIKTEKGESKKVLIKKLVSEDLATISRAGKGDAATMTLYTVYRGLVRPKLDMQQIGKMHPDVLRQLSEAIMKHSGLGLEAMAETENF